MKRIAEKPFPEIVELLQEVKCDDPYCYFGLQTKENKEQDTEKICQAHSSIYAIFTFSRRGLEYNYKELSDNEILVYFKTRYRVLQIKITPDLIYIKHPNGEVYLYRSGLNICKGDLKRTEVYSSQLYNELLERIKEDISSGIYNHNLSFSIKRKK